MSTTVQNPAPTTSLRHRVLRLAEMVTTPLVPADYLDIVSPLRAGADLRGRIVAIHPETRDAVTLVIRPGAGWNGHTPGQYVRIGVDVDGVRQWRAYSLTSAGDRTDGCITITVKAIPDGKVSNHLVRRARPGTVIHLDQAAGDFVLPAEAPAKVLFLTAGSGITPVMGMLRNLSTVAAGRERARLDTLDVVLVHSAPTPADVVFGGELRMLAARDRIRLVERHTDAEGMLDPADLVRLVPDYAQRQTWACGPTGMLDAVEERWTSEGIGDRLHTERFRPSVVVTGEGGTVRFTASDVTLEADGATPLLDAGEAGGVLMPSGCRMGICFGCVVPLVEGAVRDLRNGEITTAAPHESGAGGVPIQTCVSAAAGACDINL
ncbi:MAG TPA: ferredoxin reductase [Nocardioidaceae bacterium]|nr:ferredoxin reductase [Nocardioidaceae bacterium]